MVLSLTLARQRARTATATPPSAQPPTFPALAQTGAQQAQDAAALDFIRSKHRELMAHLEVAYPGDRRAQTLKLNLADIRLMPEYVFRRDKNYALFTFATGVMELSPRELSGTLRPRPKLLMSYLHEAAHCISSFVRLPDGHDPAWRAHMLWLTGVATEELKWNVTVACSYCKTYQVCTAAQCPACGWECGPSPTLGPAPTVARSGPTPAFAEYPAEAYTRVCVTNAAEGSKYDWWKAMCAAYKKRPRT